MELILQQSKPIVIEISSNFKIDDIQSDWNEGDASSKAYIKNKPTKLSQFENDSQFIKNTVNNLTNYYLKKETYTKEEVNALIAGMTHLTFKKAGSVDEVTEPNIIYLVPSAKTEEDNTYDEYILLDGKPEMIGTTKVDLSSYYTKEEADGKFQTKTDNTLQTSAKTVPGAINELVSAVFPLSISVTGGGVYKKGTTQAITVRWTIKAGSEIVVPDTLKVNGALETNTNTSKQFTGVTATTTYTVEATRNGVVKSASTTATFVNPSYIGVVASDFSASESSIKGLTEVVKSGKGYTATGLNLVNQKICYAYPKTFGALSSIKDANGFDNLSAYTRSEVTINGEAYYVYVMTDPASQSNVKQIYA